MKNFSYLSPICQVFSLFSKLVNFCIAYANMNIYFMALLFNINILFLIHTKKDLVASVIFKDKYLSIYAVKKSFKPNTRVSW